MMMLMSPTKLIFEGPSMRHYTYIHMVKRLKMYILKLFKTLRKHAHIKRSHILDKNVAGQEQLFHNHKDLI